MQIVHYKKRVILWCTAAFFLWLMLRKVQYKVKFDAIVKHSKPRDVWDFLADFNNFKKLNPTIVDFSIGNESGNLEHWKYTVHYTEFLSHLPFIKNYAVAHYQVKPLNKISYIIHSDHITCFFSSLTCVKSVSTFKFEPQGDSTLCTEAITYECPAIFSKFCGQEVWYQRHAIMENLQKHFTSGTT